MYATLEVDPEDINTVSAMQGLMGRTSSKALEVFTQWGELTKTASGLAAKKEFLDDYKAFDSFITGIKLPEGRLRLNLKQTRKFQRRNPIWMARSNFSSRKKSTRIS